MGQFWVEINKRLKLEQESGKQAYRRDQLELRAPQDGVVKDLATHTAGTVVSLSPVQKVTHEAGREM